MNSVVLIGRIVRDPSISTGTSTVAKYTLAVDRKFKKDGDAEADFINCVAFGKSAEFVENYLKKGTKIAVTGRIQTGSYTNKEGQKVYTTYVVVESHEFCESKGSSAGTPSAKENKADGFIAVDSSEEELPFI